MHYTNVPNADTLDSVREENFVTTSFKVNSSVKVLYLNIFILNWQRI